MKFKVQMKDPDVLNDAISDAVKGIDFGTKDEDEIAAIRDVREEKVSKLCNQWFEYGEYLTVEIDTDAETCTVVAAWNSRANAPAQDGHIVQRAHKAEAERDALKDELHERLVELDHCRDVAGKVEDMHRERAEGLERDAARYLWLRNESIKNDHEPSVYDSDSNGNPDYPLDGKDLDEAIDAALAKGGATSLRG